MPIYAVAETVPERNRGRITPGKRYALVPHEWDCDERGLHPSGLGFAWVGDTGNVHFAKWQGSAHLDGGDWTRIDEEEPDNA